MNNWALRLISAVLILFSLSLSLIASLRSSRSTGNAERTVLAPRIERPQAARLPEPLELASLFSRPKRGGTDANLRAANRTDSKAPREAGRDEADTVPFSGRKVGHLRLVGGKEMIFVRAE